eukprot:SAG22_NODE_1131_length_5456_cov_2.950719_3_plen_385_part_00
MHTNLVWSRARAADAAACQLQGPHAPIARSRPRCGAPRAAGPRGRGSEMAAAAAAAGLAVPLSEHDVDGLARQFDATGFVVLPSLLGAAEVAEITAAIDRDRLHHSEDWKLRGMQRTLGYCPGPGDGTPDPSKGKGPRGEDGRWQPGDGFLERDESGTIDRYLAHPTTTQLVAKLMGPTARYQGASVTVREPVPHAPDPEFVSERQPGAHWRMWHRETAASFLPSHERRIMTMQVVFFLTGCDQTTHCLSIVPESLDEKKALPLTRHPQLDWDGTDVRMVDQPFTAHMFGERVVDRPEVRHGVDIFGPPGTAVLMNNANIHCGTVRQTLQRRVSLRIDYGHIDHAMGGRRTVGPLVDLPARSLAAQLPEHRWLFEDGRGSGARL